MVVQAPYFTTPALPLGELGGCLGRQKDRKCNCVVQTVTNVYQVKVYEHDESEWNTLTQFMRRQRYYIISCVLQKV